MVASKDNDGLVHLMATTADPFQKALVVASIEHLSIQADKPDLAETYATQMPETTSECRLVKAEALSAAAEAHLRHAEQSYAVAAFAAATRLASSAEDLPFGEVQVFTEIAGEETQDPATASLVLTSLRNAEAIASKLPIFIPRSVSAPQRPIHQTRQYYRHEAFELVLKSSAQTGHIDFAREVADNMAKAGPSAVSRVVDAWCLAGQKAEAIRFARKLPDSAERIKAILSLAGSLLNEAGAPNI